MYSCNRTFANQLCGIHHSLLKLVCATLLGQTGASKERAVKNIISVVLCISSLNALINRLDYFPLEFLLLYWKKLTNVNALNVITSKK